MEVEKGTLGKEYEMKLVDFVGHVRYCDSEHP
jgi:hypothetical protein